MNLNAANSDDDASPTHGQHGNSSGKWRKGSTGFAELSPGHGVPGLQQHWLVTGWLNRDLDNHPFYKLDDQNLPS